MMKTLGASAHGKVSLLSSCLKTVAVLAVLAGFGLTAQRAEATHAGHAAAAKSAKEAVTSVSAQDVETTSSVQPNTASPSNCELSRKRLFVEGEGWIVRRVTTCY
jgi:hypothetical protein